MANEGDDSQVLEELHLRVSLMNAKAKRTSGPVATGFCLYCKSDEVKKGNRWCDNYCRDDWQDEENAKRRKNGGSLISDSSLAGQE